MLEDKNEWMKAKVKELYESYINGRVSLRWTKGHVGTKYNEMADEWANRARMGATIEKL